MKNLYNFHITPKDWQKTDILHDKDILIIAPTGAGKTIAAYNWAFYDSENTNRIIFTAPIKALSNERYFELKKILGSHNVGILTGDVKINPNAKFLCMTQEIYTNAFASIPNQKVIIDEVHYMFQDITRSRAYLDGIVNTNPDSRLMLLSATVNPSISSYFEDITNRNLHFINITERPVEIKYIGRVSIDKIIKKSPALIFLFSVRGVIQTAKNLKLHTKNLYINHDAINSYIEKFKIVNQELIKFINAGIGIYHGGMLYKEKIFIEKLFREKLIHIIVGTDSLALGVNLPAKLVVFGQLAKYYDGPITKREFLQMSGRAGRPNLFNRGYVGWFGSGFESFDYNTGDLYDNIINAELEPEHLILTPDYKSIFKYISYEELKNKSNKINNIIKEEIEYIMSYSILPKKKSVKKTKKQYENDISYAVNFIAENIKSDFMYQVFKDIYFAEFSYSLNLHAAKLISESGYIDAIKFWDNNAEKYEQREMLQFLRFFNSIKHKYNIIRLNEFIEIIQENDEFVLNPDELSENI